VTGARRPEAEQLIASANRAQETTFHAEQGGDSCHPARRRELSARTGSNDIVKDFPDPTADGQLIDASRIAGAAGRAARSIPGFQAAADKCIAISSSALRSRAQ
jgi:hypothetical protein